MLVNFFLYANIYFCNVSFTESKLYSLPFLRLLKEKYEIIFLNHPTILTHCFLIQSQFLFLSAYKDPLLFHLLNYVLEDNLSEEI